MRPARHHGRAALRFKSACACRRPAVSVQEEPDQEPDARNPDERAEGKRQCVIPCHGLNRAQMHVGVLLLIRVIATSLARSTSYRLHSPRVAIKSANLTLTVQSA
jgi:hypothetical protein